jgi:hypothetical protein
MLEKDVSFTDKALLHAEKTWHHVLTGHSSLSEKVEFGAEALLAAGAAVALHKIGLSNLGLTNLGKSAGKVGDVLSEFAIGEAPAIRSKNAAEAFYAPHSPIIRIWTKVLLLKQPLSVSRCQSKLLTVRMR